MRGGSVLLAVASALSLSTPSAGATTGPAKAGADARLEAVDMGGQEHSGDRRPLMRRLEHSEISSLELGAHGEVIHLGAHSLSPKDKAATKGKGANGCSESYTLGVVDTNDCNTGHHTILDRDVCHYAAAAANLSQGDPVADIDWEIALVNQTEYPHGCFKREGKIWYNPYGDIPPNPGQGGGGGNEPVCSLPRYANGTTGASAGSDYGCSGLTAGAYYSISGDDDEELCKTLARCMGYCRSTEMRIGDVVPEPKIENRAADAEMYDIYPKGCFIKTHGEYKDDCVYWNVPRAAEPANPQGTPLCAIAEWVSATS